MAKGNSIKVGDLFEIDLKDSKKGYFQFISLDKTQLNSEVVRVFKEKYDLDQEPRFEEIVNGKIQLYVHVPIKLGIKKKLWNKVGSISLENNLELPNFRSSRDYGNPEVKVSKDWYVWSVNEEMIHVGELTDAQKNFDIGVVYSVSEISDIMSTGKSKYFYPSY